MSVYITMFFIYKDTVLQFVVVEFHDLKLPVECSYIYMRINHTGPPLFTYILRKYKLNKKKIYK